MGDRIVTVAVTQMVCDWDIPGNLDRAEGLVREAAGAGAGLVLLQELFETPYFCAEQNEAHLTLARPCADNPLIQRFAALAAELNVVLPISFFERDHNTFYNSLTVADADGALLGLYRKSHIPNGPGYQEKSYFAPGDTGFKVFDTAVGRIGAAICWDQWFPECARAMALQGAEILLYPTAIGSEPQAPDLHSMRHWQRTMRGHAAANLIPVMASNRVGVESWEGFDMTFYGGSFVAGAEGEMLVEMENEGGIALSKINLCAIRSKRQGWGIFRDRRRDLYSGLL